ncbi:MAG: DUF2024 family protein [Alphaproteobacteria bacterium]
MEVDVYDTYAQSAQGRMIHFDVLVPSGTSADQAFAYAKAWLEEIGENAQGLDQSRCNFCHVERARPHVQNDIQKQGYHILQMEGCPQSVV